MSHEPEQESKKVYSDEINYEMEYANHSDVIYRYLYPQNSASATLTSGGVYGPTSIVIPPACFNFAKSSLNGQIFIPASANNYNYINANTLTTISRMRIFDQFSNAVWMDVSNFNQTMSCLVPGATRITEFLTKSFYGSLSFSGTATVVSTIPASSSANSQLYAVESICRFNSQPVALQVTSGTPTAYVATYTAPTNIVASGTNSSVDLFPQNSFTGRKQFYISGASNTTSYLDFNISLSAVKFSVCSVDKLMWNASNLQMDIWWNNTDNFAFTSTSSSDPTTSPASITGAPLINNIALVLANENNLQLISHVIDTITKDGLKVQIPWMTATRQTISASSSHSYQIALSSAYGNSLLAIVTAPFQSTTSGASAPYANVHQRGTISTYNTFINNISISNPSYFNALQCQDFMVGNRRFLKGSTVQTLGEYILAEWIHVDSWCGTKPLYEIDVTDVDGLDLRRQNSVFQLQSTLTTSSTYSWLSILIGQKTLSLSSQGSLVF